MTHRRMITAAAAAVAVGAVAAAGLTAGPGADAASKRPKLPGLRLGCEDEYGSVRELRSRPATCVVFSGDRDFERSADLHRLRWSRWTTAGASATGTECGFGARCAGRRVRVTLSGHKRLKCSSNTYAVFTKMTVTYGSGAVKRLRPAVCPNSDPD